MKRRRLFVTLTIAALALTTLLILTVLPLAGAASPRPEWQPSESLTGLSSTEATERGSPPAASVVQSPGTTTRISAALRSAPVMFIENVGQFDERARFQVRGGMGTIWLAEDAIWITVLEKPSSPQPPSPNLGEEGAFLPSPEFGRGAGGEGQPRKGVNLRLTFPGANPHPRLEPFDRLETHVSYFIGNDPAKWRADVPVWGGVRYKDLFLGLTWNSPARMASGSDASQFATRNSQFPTCACTWRVRTKWKEHDYENAIIHYICSCYDRRSSARIKQRAAHRRADTASL